MAGGRFLRIGIAAHLDDIKPAVRVVADAYRIRHERLDRGQLKVESRMDAKRFKSRRGFKRLDSRQLAGEVFLAHSNGTQNENECHGTS
jgi:hypothetical protein